MGQEVLRAYYKELLSLRCGLVQLCVIVLVVTNGAENVGKKATCVVADACPCVSPLGASGMRTLRLSLGGCTC